MSMRGVREALAKTITQCHEHEGRLALTLLHSYNGAHEEERRPETRPPNPSLVTNAWVTVSVHDETQTAKQNLEIRADITCLEDQQRYFSYRAILVAVVSQNSFVLVFMGYRTVIARYVAKWGIAQMSLCEAK